MPPASTAGLACEAHHAVTFTLRAEPEPGMLPRLLIPLARRDLTPDRLAATRAGAALHVEIALTAPGGMVALIEGNLRQVVGVHSVERQGAMLVAA